MSISVVGFGRTGKALLNFILKRNLHSRIILFDDNSIRDQDIQKNFEAQGVDFYIGSDQFSVLEEVALVVLSPGVNGRDERFVDLRKKGVEIISEIEFAFRNLSTKIVAVTGTNGKSTTVTLIHHFLTLHGFNSVLAGNIGVPLIAQVEKIEDDSVAVLEMSSFQLEEIVKFKPNIAVILNITPDHLDRYANMAEYVETKMNIARNQSETEYLILNHDDEILVECAPKVGKVNQIWFSGKSAIEEGAYYKEKMIYFENGDETIKISMAQNPLPGVHNRENLMAAVIVVSLLGIKGEEIEESLKSFKGLPHRMENLGRIGKVNFINDSKATNVDAALKSIQSMDQPTVLILGGLDKGGNFGILSEVIREKVKRVLLLGRAASIIHGHLYQLADRCDYVADLREAVKKGYQELNESEGVVLLAPGCASFDMFDSYEHRGEVFSEEIRRLAEEMESGDG